MHSEAGHAKDPKQHGFSDVIQELNTIRKLTCHTTVNNLNATSGGNYSSQVIDDDFFNKRVTHHHPYNYFDSFKNEKHINTFHGKHCWRWGGGVLVTPTGKSFRFVRACERARRGEAA